MKPMTDPEKARRLELVTHTIRVIGCDDLRRIVGGVVKSSPCRTR